MDKKGFIKAPKVKKLSKPRIPKGRNPGPMSMGKALKKLKV
jgi:hypothetical protein